MTYQTTNLARKMGPRSADRGNEQRGGRDTSDNHASMRTQPKPRYPPILSSKNLECPDFVFMVIACMRFILNFLGTHALMENAKVATLAFYQNSVHGDTTNTKRIPWARKGHNDDQSASSRILALPAARCGLLEAVLYAICPHRAAQLYGRSQAVTVALDPKLLTALLRLRCFRDRSVPFRRKSALGIRVGLRVSAEFIRIR
jgi:hypothetical protein